MANTLLHKNTELNNILKDYSIVACTNSYILNYEASRVEVPYNESVVQGDISQYLELNVTNRINNFKATYNIRNEFNFDRTYYQSGAYIEPNSLIISNLANDEISSDPNSYIVFYNTEYGLKQLTYHYKEGNGLYYDDANHIFGMNIDNTTIKEMNKKLYFDTNSIPISTKDNYGIGYIDTRYLRINNGILSIKPNYIENVISYKYKIKNLYERLTNIYNSLSYFNNIYENKNDVIDEFVERFDKLNDGEENKSIKTEISYHKTNSLYFPQSEIKYIDNYYFDNGLINENYKQYITLDENNSYIIYCKDIEKLYILSYISNDYMNYSNTFNRNKIRSIEDNLLNSDDLIDISNIDTNNLDKYISNNNNQEILSNNTLYTYIYSDETNNYNKFIIQSNIVNNILYSLPVNAVECSPNDLLNNQNIQILFKNYKVFVKRYSNDFEYYLEVLIPYVKANTNETFYKCPIKNVRSYQMTKSKFKYKNKFIDEKLFKKLGIILNSKISLPTIKKNIIKYIKNGTTIQYDYTIQSINCQYPSKNIKILYDDRDITYCSYNVNAIPYDKDVYYFLSNYDYGNTKEINDSISFILRNNDISFDNRLQYLFYGYSWTMRDYQIFNKNYYGIWHDLPTYYITSNFMKLIINMDPDINHTDSFNATNIVLDNFKELYTENFNEIEFNKNDYHPLTLYLYKIYRGPDDQYDKISKVNNVTINI